MNNNLIINFLSGRMAMAVSPFVLFAGLCGLSREASFWLSPSLSEYACAVSGFNRGTLWISQNYLCYNSSINDRSERLPFTKVRGLDSVAPFLFAIHASLPLNRCRASRWTADCSRRM